MGSIIPQGRVRIAVLDKAVCINGQGCDLLCQRVCPVNKVGKDCITVGSDNKPVISEELCIGCKICEHKCPVKCISIVNLSMDLGRPLHSFGENSFRLHRLPVPKQGQVVGLIGRNGIGKSTAFKVLSNHLVPNLGAFSNEAPAREAVLSAFKGKELYPWFFLLYNKGLKTAFKPQQVDVLGRALKGSVQDVLRKADETNRFDAVVKALHLEALLEREVSHLSGGELQKLAIGIAGLRKAGVYFFDEPSSYLDIRERLRIATFIRSLARDAAVFVVEHDLILLDYLSEYVHLLYGKPSVFGVVSQVKGVREGLNTYLEGYSREENYRFRAFPIEFEVRDARTYAQGVKKVEWPGLFKRLDSFSLEVEPNGLNAGEVVGVVGPNGIGKTTFVKMLAGVLTPDKGTVPAHVSVAYKPQYVEGHSPESVESVLRSKIPGFDSKEFHNGIGIPLELNALLDRPLNVLSGGELQRVALALCLGLEAELYVLDEPSAHLDVEQRLAVVKALRGVADQRKASMLVVDHDLLFLDYAADRLMVFSGEPAVQGKGVGPLPMEEGMNVLLKELGITLRRDSSSHRPRINKPGSQKDEEQKASGHYYYTN